MPQISFEKVLYKFFGLISHQSNFVTLTKLINNKTSDKSKIDERFLFQFLQFTDYSFNHNNNNIHRPKVIRTKNLLNFYYF